MTYKYKKSHIAVRFLNIYLKIKLHHWSCNLFLSTIYDPDGDNLSFLWFHYPEAGSYKKEVKINGAENAHGAFITAPKVDQKETLHFILKVTDKGTPTLSRYQRIIVTVVPK